MIFPNVFHICGANETIMFQFPAKVSLMTDKTINEWVEHDSI